MMDIHAERGLQCADCHFAQDSHGNGFIYGEVANAIEIGCRDCHGTARDYANLRTSGPAAPPRGRNLETIRNEDGRRRFEWVSCERARDEVPAIECAGEQRILLQRSIVDPNLGWAVSQVRDSGDRSLPACHDRGDQPTEGPCFNLRSARAKLIARAGRRDRALSVRRRAFRDGELAHPGQRDGLLHLPPVLDDELRRLPPADRGELAHHDATIMRARRRAISRPTTRRSRATTCSSSAAT